MDPNSELGKTCLEESLFSGFKAGVMASVVSGGLYLLAVKHSPFFRNTFSASARTALTIMPVFYTGYLQMELHMHKCMQAAKPEYVALPDHHGHQPDEDNIVRGPGGRVTRR